MPTETEKRLLAKVKDENLRVCLESAIASREEAERTGNNYPVQLLARTLIQAGRDQRLRDVPLMPANCN